MDFGNNGEWNIGNDWNNGNGNGNDWNNGNGNGNNWNNGNFFNGWNNFGQNDQWHNKINEFKENFKHHNNGKPNNDGNNTNNGADINNPNAAPEGNNNDNVNYFNPFGNPSNQNTSNETNDNGNTNNNNGTENGDTDNGNFNNGYTNIGNGNNNKINGNNNKINGNNINSNSFNENSVQNSTSEDSYSLESNTNNSKSKFPVLPILLCLVVLGTIAFFIIRKKKNERAIQEKFENINYQDENGLFGNEQGIRLEDDYQEYGNTYDKAYNDQNGQHSFDNPTAPVEGNNNTAPACNTIKLQPIDPSLNEPVDPSSFKEIVVDYNVPQPSIDTNFVDPASLSTAIAPATTAPVTPAQN